MENKIEASCWIKSKNQLMTTKKTSTGVQGGVFKALQDYLDLGDLPSFKAVPPLAAGIAMRGETCWALIAGLMAIGIVTASEQSEDANAFINSLSVGFKLARKLEKEFGSTSCTKIQTDKLGKFYNLADLKQYKAFIEAGVT